MLLRWLFARHLSQGSSAYKWRRGGSGVPLFARFSFLGVSRVGHSEQAAAVFRAFLLSICVHEWHCLFMFM